MNYSDIIVYDFETGGLDPDYHEAIQIAGKAYNARTLEPYPIESGGEFCSMMRPLHFDRLEPKALACNGKTIAELETAPDQGVVWKQFIAWVNTYNKKKSRYMAPIRAGKNIINFDDNFARSLNALYCSPAKKSDSLPMFNRQYIDLENLFFGWFENEKEPTKAGMDALREFFGMSKDGAHDALVDVRQTGELIMKFLKLQRSLQRRFVKGPDGKPKKFIQFKDCFKGTVA